MMEYWDFGILQYWNYAMMEYWNDGNHKENYTKNTK